MQKKYIQLLLSINFCLTAIAAATASEYEMTPDHEISETSNDYIYEEDSNWVADTQTELNTHFYHIGNCLENMHIIQQSKLLHGIIPHYKSITPQDETLEEVSLENLDYQFIQLHKDLNIYSQYLSKLDEDSKTKLGIQFSQITHHFMVINRVYNTRKASLSKKEKGFLKNQLDNLHRSFYNFTEEASKNNIDHYGISEDHYGISEDHYGISEPSNNHINEKKDNWIAVAADFESSEEEIAGRVVGKIQSLLNSYKEEDSLIYPQYEYIINSQEVNVSDLLTSFQAENNTKSHFLYFNKAEGLIELQHILENKDLESYTTTWKIRPADVNLIKDWQEDDLITIDKTSVFSKYTMRGESLQYILNNTNKSVRANFICKSSNQNTYTILSIDYLENIVILKNGPCLFVQRGDLKEWHVKDIVVLQRSGSVVNTNIEHELINKTRNKTIWVCLKKRL